MYAGKTVLITGGTGSFGQAFVEHLLKDSQIKKVIILSRDEMKQWEMSQKYLADERVRFFIGDVRDKSRLIRAFSNVDIVIHAAAMKIVETAEYNPIECIKTNIMGAMNVIDAALDCKVSKVIALSTDKAAAPINLYGATKLASDKLFVSANSYSGDGTTKFSVVRYGNVMGSRGSVIPYFLSIQPDEPLPVTDVKMTRFMIKLEEGIELVNFAIKDMRGGEIYVKKIPSMKVVDIAKAINQAIGIKIVGRRPGEKIHEQMIISEDAPNTIEFDDYFVINHTNTESKMVNCEGNKGNPVPEGFVYSSDTNSDWMSVLELQSWINSKKKNNCKKN